MNLEDCSNRIQLIPALYFQFLLNFPTSSDPSNFNSSVQRQILFSTSARTLQLRCFKFHFELSNFSFFERPFPTGCNPSVIKLVTHQHQCDYTFISINP